VITVTHSLAHIRRLSISKRSVNAVLNQLVFVWLHTIVTLEVPLIQLKPKAHAPVMM